MSYDTDLTGTVTEAYQTPKGKYGLIINCDNPSFKYPVKAYDGTFGEDLGINVFQVGDKVSFQFDKTDFGNQFKHCKLADGSAPQVNQNADTSFNHGANVENRATEVKTLPDNKYKDYLLEISNAMEAIENFPSLKNLDQENKRAIAISAVINKVRNGR